MKDKLSQEIVNLISLKQEGGYWDFKKSWYENKKDDLLHDIICMANNLENHDAYIIIGVDEETDYSLIDITRDPNRKNTQNIVDFLKTKAFAGGMRPSVYVVSLNLSKTIDVIVVKNSNHTPFYLSEKYCGVFHNHIYTRIQDTNTPKTDSADIDKVEYLWKKRFGIDKDIKSRFLILLDELENWVFKSEYLGYHAIYPEFQVLITNEFSRNDFQLMPERIFFIDNNYYSGVITLKYHSTIIYRSIIHHYDGGKIMLPGYEYLNLSPCYVLTNFTGKLLKLFLYRSDKDYSFNANPYLKEINDVRSHFFLVFDSEEQKKDFEKYDYSISNDKKEEICQIWAKKVDEYNSNNIYTPISFDYLESMILNKYKFEKYINR